MSGAFTRVVHFRRPNKAEAVRICSDPNSLGAFRTRSGPDMRSSWPCSGPPRVSVGRRRGDRIGECSRKQLAGRHIVIMAATPMFADYWIRVCCSPGMMGERIPNTLR